MRVCVRVRVRARACVRARVRVCARECVRDPPHIRTHAPHIYTHDAPTTHTNTHARTHTHPRYLSDLTTKARSLLAERLKEESAHLDDPNHTDYVDEKGHAETAEDEAGSSANHDDAGEGAPTDPTEMRTMMRMIEDLNRSVVRLEQRIDQNMGNHNDHAAEAK